MLGSKHFAILLTCHRPTRIAHEALMHWNAYLTSRANEHKEAFLAQSSYLLAHQVLLADDIGGWPIPFPLPCYYASRPWLSALTQASGISVLIRAHLLSKEDAFLDAARRALRTFELDILDGGVSVPVDDSVFFEQVAVYPAAHILSGHMLALLSLYEYVTLTGDSKIEALTQRGLAALYSLIDAYDTGFWTRHDLLHKHLASQLYHSLHIDLLQALAEYSSSEQCAAIARQWSGYQTSSGCRLRYFLARLVTSCYSDKLCPWLRRLAFGTAEKRSPSFPARVCIPITGFPIAGGMSSVLAGVAQVIGDRWQTTYITRYRGQGAEALKIETFGQGRIHPWQFPGVWLYCLTGWCKLFALLRHGPGYDLILPQDGVFSCAFAGLIGKMAGIRVVCMDHGNVTWLDSPSLEREWMKALVTYPWYRRLLSRLLFSLYRPSLSLLARIAVCCTDQFLVAGDEVEDTYRRRLGVHPSRIIRYRYMVDVARFTPPDEETRAKRRMEQGISREAIVITLINRLATEKGLDFAIEGLALAMTALSPELRRRVRVLIVGDGPLRSQVEADIERYRLTSACLMWGKALPADVVMLLGISDIFLYSGTRGTNYSMAVLEAMAASCAVIASTAPRSNIGLLAEGRGIAVKPGDAAAISAALVRLCSDRELCQQMGQRARQYMAAYHTSEMLKRNLLRASFFAPSLESNASRLSI